MRRTVKILLLEDNFLIGLKTTQVLEKNGFSIMGPYGTLQDAYDALNQAEPDIAILDINLGQGITSEPFAQTLMDRNIPFLFLTGYGSADILQPPFDTVPRLSKPANAASLIAHIEIVLVHHKDSKT